MQSYKEILSLKKNSKELLTPYKICLLISMKLYCQSLEKTELNNFSESETFEFRQKYCLILLKLLQSPDLKYVEFKKLIENKEFSIFNNFFTHFETTVRNVYKNQSEGLADLMKSVSKLFAMKKQYHSLLINKQTFAGCYIRRILVYFERLDFFEVTVVSNALRDYFLEGEKEYENLTACEKAINIYQSNNWYHSQVQWSQRQAELFIMSQANFIENNEKKALSPPELGKHIRDILNSKFDLAEAHFLNYLNYLRVKEYCGAMKSLLLFFDRKVPHVEKENVLDDRLNLFRYAALNLAILYIRFGHRDEAMLALKESITLSQKAGDNVCLQQAMIWSYSLTQKYSEKSLKRTISKCYDLNLYNNASILYRNLALNSIVSKESDSIDLASIKKSDLLSMNHKYQDLVLCNYVMKSLFWNLHGKLELASLYSQALLHASSIQLVDNRAYYGESVCICLCNIANRLLMDGHYDAATLILKTAKKEFPHEPVSSHWFLTELQHLYTRNFNLNNCSVAEAIAKQILIVNKEDGLLKMAEINCLKENFNDARIIALKLRNICKTNSFYLANYYLILSTLLLVEVNLSDSSETTLISIAGRCMELLNEILRLATSLHYMYFVVWINLHLAHLMLKINCIDESLQLVEKYLPYVLTNGGCFDKGRCLLLYAKCLVAHSGKHSNTSMRNKAILVAMDHLEEAILLFKKVENHSRVLDALYLKGILLNEVEMYESRDECCQVYLKYLIDHPTKVTKTLSTSF